MKMDRRCMIISAALLALLLGVTGQLQATIVTVDPDNFPRLADLSRAVPGVVFAVVDDDGRPSVANTVVALEGTAPSTGRLVFGRQVDAFVPDQYWFESGLKGVPGVLRADFARPTNFVAIDIINIGSTNVGRLRAFDGANNLLEAATVNLGGVGTFVTASISRPVADIA